MCIRDRWNTAAEPPNGVVDDGHGKRIAGIALLSLSAVAVVGGTTCLLIANDKIDSIEKDAKAGARYNESNGSFPTFQRLSQILFGTAGATAVAGAWMLFSRGSSGSAPEAGTTVAPTLVGMGAAGLAFSGRF